MILARSFEMGGVEVVLVEAIGIIVRDALDISALSGNRSGGLMA